MKPVIVLLIWLIIFVARFFNSFQAEAKLGQLEGREIKLVGRVSSEPLLQGRSQRLNMGRIRVIAKQYPEYEYGQKLTISGTLQRKVVNRWYSQFSLMYPDISLMEADRWQFIGFDWKEAVLRLKQRIELVYNTSLPEPEASLLAGIVLGVKRNLPSKFWQALQRTGTLHIVVASGYNVTVVIGTTVAYLAGIFKRRTAISLGILFVIGYTVMAGAEPAIVRAAIMGSLGYLGQMLGRKADGVRLLPAAVAVMLIVEPMFIFDIGFQLSFLATLGLLIVAPRLEKVFGRVWLIGKDISQTTAAQLMVWPVIFINFGQVSWFSILVNSLILWMVPIIMGLGAILAGVGLVSAGLGQWVGWLTYVPLTVMVRVIEEFSRL